MTKFNSNIEISGRDVIPLAIPMIKYFKTVIVIAVYTK
jgi:hypothetical protein